MFPEFVPVLHWKSVVDKTKITPEQKALVDKLEPLIEQLDEQQELIYKLARHVRDSHLPAATARSLLRRYEGDGTQLGALAKIDSYIRESLRPYEESKKRDIDVDDFLSKVKRNFELLKANLGRLEWEVEQKLDLADRAAELHI